MPTALLIIAVVVLYFFFKAKSKRPTARGAPMRHAEPALTPAPAVAGPTFHWSDGGNFDFEVVGESFYQAHLKTVAGPHGDNWVEVAHMATLIPEDHNEHDNKAVGVYIVGAKVGHLGRDDARSFRRRLAAKKLAGQNTSCDAIVRGGGLKNGERAAYGVWLDLKPFG